MPENFKFIAQHPRLQLQVASIEGDQVVLHIRIFNPDGRMDEFDFAPLHSGEAIQVELQPIELRVNPVRFSEKERLQRRKAGDN